MQSPRKAPRVIGWNPMHEDSRSHIQFDAARTLAAPDAQARQVQADVSV